MTKSHLNFVDFLLMESPRLKQKHHKTNILWAIIIRLKLKQKKAIKINHERIHRNIWDWRWKDKNCRRLTFLSRKNLWHFWRHLRKSREKQSTKREFNSLHKTIHVRIFMFSLLFFVFFIVWISVTSRE